MLDLGPQVIARGDHALERFFWACSASSVNTKPFRSSASIRSGAAGISLLFLRDHPMAEHDLIGLPQRRHHVSRLAVVKTVETAAQRLAVHGDRRQTVRRGRRRNRGRVLSERGLQRRGIDALNDQPQARIGGRIGQPRAESFVQALQMNANEFIHLTVGIGAGYHSQDRVEHQRRQIERLAFRATMVRDRAQNLQYATPACDNLRFGLSRLNSDIYARGKSQIAVTDRSTDAVAPTSSNHRRARPAHPEPGGYSSSSPGSGFALAPGMT